MTFPNYPLRLVVFGSRGWKDEEIIFKMCDQLIGFYRKEEVLVITGGAVGADEIGTLWSKKRAFDNLIMRPLWCEVPGAPINKAAGYERNKRMAHLCTEGVGFWDGYSKGTHQMYRYIVNTLKKPCTLVQRDYGGEYTVKTYNMEHRYRM